MKSWAWLSSKSRRLLRVSIRLNRNLVRRALCDPSHEFEELFVGQLPFERKLFVGRFELPNAFFKVGVAENPHLRLSVLVHNMLWCQEKRTPPLAP